MEDLSYISTERLAYIANQALAMQRWHLDLHQQIKDDEELWIANFYAGRAALYKEEICRRSKIA